MKNSNFSSDRFQDPRESKIKKDGLHIITFYNISIIGISHFPLKLYTTKTYIFLVNSPLTSGGFPQQFPTDFFFILFPTSGNFRTIALQTPFAKASKKSGRATAGGSSFQRTNGNNLPTYKNFIIP